MYRPSQQFQCPEEEIISMFRDINDPIDAILAKEQLDKKLMSKVTAITKKARF